MEEILHEIIEEESNELKLQLDKKNIELQQKQTLLENSKIEKQREIELVWHVPDLYENAGKFSINDRHSLLARFSTSLDPIERKLFKNVLKLISKTLTLFQNEGGFFI